MSPRRIIVLMVLSLVISGTALWFTNLEIEFEDATWEEVHEEAEAGGYQILTTEELYKMHQEVEDLVIVDTRQEWEYRLGHVENAENFFMQPWFWDRWMKRGDLRDFLSEHARDKETALVFY